MIGYCVRLSTILVIILTTSTHALANWSHIATKTLASGIEISPTLSILIPAYVLYADHQLLGSELISEKLEKRIRSILNDIGYEPCKNFVLKKLDPRYSQSSIWQSMRKFMPIKKYKENILAVPAPNALYIDEYQCLRLNDEQLREKLLPCILFLKNKTLEKSILSALITPIATDYGTRLLNYLITVFIDMICLKISQEYPTLSLIICSSNTLFDFLLTNFITKFILNAQLINYITTKQLQSLEQQSKQLLSTYYEQNHYFTHLRSSENCCG